MSYSEKIRSVIIDVNSDLITALKLMDEVNKKLLIVFDNKKFRGVVSIGDIQRGIIANIGLDQTLDKVLRENLTFASSTENLGALKEKIHKHRIEFMPILDKNGDLEDVVFWEDLFDFKYFTSQEKLSTPVVIMAGGKGTRMKPLTNVIPKPLIPLGEKPVIEQIVNSFNRIGVNEFHFSVGYKGDLIAYYFNEIQDKSYNINYFKEDKPLGTAGSLHLLKDKIDQTFFVTNCDIFIDQDYHEIYSYHKKNNNHLTIVGAIKNYDIPYGTLNTGIDGELQEIKEKPNLNFNVNTGMYILEAELLKIIPENKYYHITHLIEKLINDKDYRVGVFPVSEGSWYDIGTWAEYVKSQEVFTKRFETIS